ncbi:MAG: DUF4252 domain-containing protein [Cyclobacteriaceae bacterium]|nr:DUF4252 domain-containing protein [Cyclobacteriaceae bacterium]
MKIKILLSLVVVAVSMSSMAQSRSYNALKDNFKGQPDVHSFSVNGWFGRMILNMAGESEVRQAIQDLKHVRLITIPRHEFNNRNLSVNGFKSLMRQDGFEDLAQIKDNGEVVSIYIQEGKSKTNNRYLMLIEEPSEIVAIELTGYIDPSKLVPSENSEVIINQ